VNRPSEARAQLDTALTLDPLALQIRNGLGNHYQWRGDYDAAIREYRNILAIDPGFQNARRWLADAYLEAGKPLVALPLLDSLPPGFADDDPALRGWALAQLGRFDEARAALGVARDQLGSGLAWVQGYWLLGRPDDAFRVLRAAFEQRSYDLLQIVFVPTSDPLRTDPRFNQLLGDIGLARYWQ